MPTLLSTPSTSTELAQGRLPYARQVPGPRRACRDGFDRSPLIEQQREELIAHHGLEGRERKLASGLLAHALKQPEPAFIGDALRDADVEQSADGRLARTALRNVTCQLFDPVATKARYTASTPGR